MGRGQVRLTGYLLFVFVAVETVLLCIAVDMYTMAIKRLAAEREAYQYRVDELNRKVVEMSLDISMLLPPCMKVDEFIATAYESSKISCGRWAKFGLTKTGTRPAFLRTVAVDPEIIPLGSLMFISGLGWFIAEDTGGKVKGKKIDIFFDNLKEARMFGVKKVLVYYQDRRCFSKMVAKTLYSESIDF